MEAFMNKGLLLLVLAGLTGSVMADVVSVDAVEEVAGKIAEEVTDAARTVEDAVEDAVEGAEEAVSEIKEAV